MTASNSNSNVVQAWMIATIVGWGAAIGMGMLAYYYKTQVPTPSAVPALAAGTGTDSERRVRAEEIAQVCAASLKTLTLVIGAECPALAAKLKAAGAAAAARP